jgi:CIC family chloride channel protein
MEENTSRMQRALAMIFREDRYFLLLSVFIGIFSGLAIVCFHYAMALFRLWFLGAAATPPTWRMLTMPALAGLIIAFLALRFFPTARGSGVNQTKGALYIFNGYIPLKTAVGKFLLASMAIGSGFSLGPEDPSLQIGACIASFLGRWVNFSRERLRLIAPVGAAAGLAAAFNAPISAVLFVIEEVIGRWTAGILGSVVLAAVSSVVVVRSFLGAEPLFRIPVVEVQRPSELIAYIVLGLVGGLLSVAFAGSAIALRPRLQKLPRWSQYLQPAAAGLLVGMIGVLGAPQVMGAGYQAMDSAMRGHFTWQFLVLLAVLKIVATLLSFISGTPGGMFAPTLFIGAMLGAAVGEAEHALLPHLSVSPGTYALVGMGVLFAGFLRAPMTSVFMILEVSGNYAIILPVIVANTVSYLVARTLQPVAIFDALTRQDGLELPSMEEEREVGILQVEDAMRAYRGRIFSSSTPLSEARAALRKEGFHALLVHTEPEGWCCLRSSDLETKTVVAGDEPTLEALLPAEPMPVLHPDQPLATALHYVDSWPLVPVVSRVGEGKLEGVVTLRAVLDCYRASDAL